MKILISVITVLFLHNLYAAEKKVSPPENPCAKDVNTPECQQYINTLKGSSPCNEDLQKFCMPKDDQDIKDIKDAKEVKALKGVTADTMSECLKKNMKKLAPKCQESLEKQTKDKCIEKLSTSCLSLKGDKKIDCLANHQIKGNDACNKH